jgi:phospholipase C
MNSAPGYGADKCNRIMRAFRDHPEVWAKTALIFCYDEDGGYFDHVAPPLPPAGTADEFVNGLPIGLGLRVPTVVCSPWTRGGFVCSQTYDHTSLIRMVERRFGVVEPQISAWRRQTCGDLWECFDFTRPDHSFPELPSTAAAASRAGDACQSSHTAPAPARNGAPPVQERGTRRRRPCTRASRPVAVHLPRTPPGQRLLGATIAVTGRPTRRLTRAELRDHKVVLRGLPAGTTADVVIRLHRRKGNARRTVVVRRTLRVRCPA